MPLISKDNNELKNQKGVLIATGENISVSGNSQKQKLPQVNLPETIDKSVRTEGGEKTHAIAKVGIEGNLRLVAANEIYRKDILDAEKKYGISAATIAALICIETGGGKIENKWDPNAVNPQGTGVGLGQFFTPTWLELATDKTGKLNQYIVKKKGYKLLVGSGRWRGYTLSDDQRTEEQKKKKLQQPIVKLNSKDISWINSLRTDAGLSIDTIALSAKKNLEGLKSRLKKNGLATSGIDNLNPLEMSKLIYFCHHESPGSAYLIMRNSIDKDTAKTNFEANVSKKVQAKYLKQGNNNYIQAYKIWMYENLIDTKVHTLEFMLNTNGLHESNMVDIEKKVLNSKQESKQESKIGGANVWFDPLKVNRMRSAGKYAAVAKSCTFGMVRNGGKRAHQGIDLEAKVGEEIRAVASGTLYAINRDFNAKGDSSFGATITLQVKVDDLPEKQKLYIRKHYPNIIFVWFFYAHLSQINSFESDEAWIEAGTPLGKTGCSGNAHIMPTVELGSHLHFEVWYLKDHGKGNKSLPTKDQDGRGLVGRFDPYPLLNNPLPPTKEKR